MEKEKRIAYAASFGVDSIPEEKQEQFKKWLEGMNHISVREFQGAKIYEQLTSSYGEGFTKEEAQYAIDHLED